MVTVIFRAARWYPPLSSLHRLHNAPLVEWLRLLVFQFSHDDGASAFLAVGCKYPRSHYVLPRTSQPGQLEALQ